MKKDLSIFKKSCRNYLYEKELKYKFNVNAFEKEYTAYANGAEIFLSKEPIKEIEEGIDNFNVRYDAMQDKFVEIDTNNGKSFVENLLGKFSTENHDNWCKFNVSKIDSYISYLNERYEENKRLYDTKSSMYASEPYCIDSEKNIWVNPMFAKCAFDFVGNTEEVYLFGTREPVLFINSEMNRMALVLPVVRNRNV